MRGAINPRSHGRFAEAGVAGRGRALPGAIAEPHWVGGLLMIGGEVSRARTIVRVTAPLSPRAENALDEGQLTRSFGVRVLELIATVDQGQFPRNIPADLMHDADSPEVPAMIEIAVGIADPAADLIVFHNAKRALQVRYDLLQTPRHLHSSVRE